MKCRFCSTSLGRPFLSLGSSPLANAFLDEDSLRCPEQSYPLEVYICGCCFLVQLEAHETPEKIFTDYPYFSSCSQIWLDHVRQYAGEMISEMGLGPRHHVVEVASNDGHLLKNFVARGIPAFGIEPARNLADFANGEGVPTRCLFFGSAAAGRLRDEGSGADLLVANNVLAHVPDLNDFVKGLKTLLNPQGLLTLEFPHLLRLVRETQFDTIYHEHFSYFSFAVARNVLATHGLRVHDVRELGTHGGSLRLYVSHAEEERIPSDRVAELLRLEEKEGLSDPGTYASFAERVVRLRQDIRMFLEEKKRQGKSVAGYGAPAKGNTLLNYCGVGRDWISFTVDRNVHKQRKFLPGSHIPIESPEAIRNARPDYVFILPWNLKEEIMDHMAFIREWGGRFVVPVPALRVLE